MGKVTERIDSVLKEKGITKKEFYSKCNVTSSAYSQWNTEKTEPRPGTLRKISDYLEVNYEWLAFGIGEKENPSAQTNEGKFSNYNKLNEVNKAIVDSMIAQLLAAQSDD